jgi:hypothetical protein
MFIAVGSKSFGKLRAQCGRPHYRTLEKTIPLLTELSRSACLRDYKHPAPTELSFVPSIANFRCQHLQIRCHPA